MVSVRKQMERHFRQNSGMIPTKHAATGTSDFQGEKAKHAAPATPAATSEIATNFETVISFPVDSRNLRKFKNRLANSSILFGASSSGDLSKFVGAACVFATPRPPF